MSDTLKSRTARSAVFIVRESLKSLRQYSADLCDPANIDRVIKTAEVLSTSLKKLEPFLDVPAGGQQPSDHSRDGPLIDIRSVGKMLTAIHEGRICADCGGIIDGSPDYDQRADIGTTERAKAHRAAEDE